MVRGPEQQQVGIPRSGLRFQETSKLELQASLKCKLLNLSIIWLQASSKQLIQNQQESMTVPVD